MTRSTDPRHLKKNDKVLSKTDVTLKLFKIFLKLFHCTIYPKNWKRKYHLAVTRWHLFIYSKSVLFNFICPSQKSPKNPHNPRRFCLNTRLRLGLSHLKQYKFKQNFQDPINPLCGYGNNVESTEHSLLHCFQYVN